MSCRRYNNSNNSSHYRFLRSVRSSVPFFLIREIPKEYGGNKKDLKPREYGCGKPAASVRNNFPFPKYEVVTRKVFFTAREIPRCLQDHSRNLAS